MTATNGVASLCGLMAQRHVPEAVVEFGRPAGQNPLACAGVLADIPGVFDVGGSALEHAKPPEVRRFLLLRGPLADSQIRSL